MKLSLIAIGSELLDGMIVDTNSVWIENELAKSGLKLSGKTVIRDDKKEILETLDFYARKNDVIIVTGGLGPTEDDRTREAVAEFTGGKLVMDERELEKLRRKFAALKLPNGMPRQNEKQALVITGSTVIPNPRGTAPGIILTRNNLTIAAFPGVPSELKAMFPELIAYIHDRFQAGEKRDSVYMRTIGLPESWLDESLSVLKEKGISVGTIAKFGQVDIRLDAGENNPGPEYMRNELDKVIGEIPRIRDRVFSFDRDESVEAALVRRLKESGKKIILAESCTGGLIAKTLTDVPGSSAVLLGSVVAYDNDIKKNILGVDGQTLAERGAVSAETVRAMDDGLRKYCRNGYRVSVTGIAGPDGGSAEKPVGTVYIAFGKDEKTTVLRFHFNGTRENVRTRTMMTVFEMLWLDLTTGSVPFGDLSGLRDLINP